MLRPFLKYYQIIIPLLVIIISLIGMVRFKRLGEMSRLEIHDYYFRVFQLVFFLSIVFFVVRWVFNLWKEYQTLKNDKNEAELMLLKSKIDPHFFFNTLNNLYGLAIEKSDQAPEVILKLSEIMRYTIYEGEHKYVTLKKEIEYLEQYLEIHKLRYKKQVDIFFEQKIDDDQVKIAPLMFIILLENAIKHGAESMVDSAYIRINLTVMGNDVCFGIENNFKSRTEKVTGIGLKNLRRRLQLLYPKRHELVMISRETEYKAILKIKI
ncbi:histidine kinase [Aquimarina sp. MMG015]|uniref:sensor histidine kinase n=1 Tax=Aquimarina sp. MMG015 TaxID=2822689 RepID=UPI001B39F8AD|nr:histidine kinase [Aquimarina sp. MMG015]MBQ4803555.1 histidine kinase [Aquimarina sp. MMG015]